MDCGLLSATDHDLFDDVYRIYSDAIPKAEQKGRDQLISMLARADYRFLVARDGVTTLGFSILFAPPNIDCCLLEYMAVDVPFRGKGIGEQLFRLAATETSRDERRPMLVEVDSAVPEGADRALRRARQDFYRRLGCRRVQGLLYLLPIPSFPGPPPMDLLVSSDPPIEFIPRARLERWLRTLYSCVYDCSPEDRRIGQMLGGLSDPVRVG